MLGLLAVEGEAFCDEGVELTWDIANDGRRGVELPDEFIGLAVWSRLGLCFAEDTL